MRATAGRSSASRAHPGRIAWAREAHWPSAVRDARAILGLSVLEGNQVMSVVAAVPSGAALSSVVLATAVQHPVAQLLVAGNLSSLTAVPIGAVVVIAALGVLELALDVVALVILIRTPHERVTMHKWGWALIIVFINLIGSILFLAIGRRQVVTAAPVSPTPETDARPSASSIADSLYGPQDGSDNS